MTTTNIDREAIRAAAIARVLTEAFTEDERSELVTETLKPLLTESKNSYGQVSQSVFGRAIERALEDWTQKAVAEYCQRPEVMTDLKQRLEVECARILAERLPKWVDRMVPSGR